MSTISESLDYRKATLLDWRRIYMPQTKLAIAVTDTIINTPSTVNKSRCSATTSVFEPVESIMIIAGVMTITKAQYGFFKILTTNEAVISKIARIPN